MTVPAKYPKAYTVYSVCDSSCSSCQNGPVSVEGLAAVRYSMICSSVMPSIADDLTTPAAYVSSLEGLTVMRADVAVMLETTMAISLSEATTVPVVTSAVEGSEQTSAWSLTA